MTHIWLCRFLIESSGMLKQDPNDVSAAALVVISRALVALAGNSSADPSMLSLPDQSAAPFMPPHNAVAINTLWYLSLATSIATSFLAMLAKGWCHSFTVNRSGHLWAQAQRRQRKWMMIERWKMQEVIIVLLPSLIHLSLCECGYMRLQTRASVLTVLVAQYCLQLGCVCTCGT
jgi:hypothetical protein